MSKTLNRVDNLNNLKNMKKLKVMIMTLMVLLVSLSYGQVSYDTYKGRKISVVLNGNSKGTIYLSVNQKESIGLILDDKSQVKFKVLINESYDKMVDWDSIAKVNNITEISLKMISEVKFNGYFLYGTKWNFGRTSVRTYMSMVGGKSNLCVYTSVITSSTNQFMKSKSSLTEFTKSELDSLLESLNKEDIDEFINSRNNVDNLFK
jgi:hypothetical protein